MINAAKQTRDQQPNRRRAERSRLQAEGVTGGRGGGKGGGGKKEKESPLDDSSPRAASQI